MFNKNNNNQERELVQEQFDIAREQNVMGVTAQDDQTWIETQAAKADFLKWQQDLESELDKLKHRLRSEVQDDQGKWHPKKVMRVQVTVDDKGKKHYEKVEVNIPPLCNEIFIDYIETQCEPFMSRNMFNSNLDETRILNLLRNTCDDIVDSMADGWDTFEIDFTNFNIIMRLIKNMITPSPFRALKGWTKKVDSSMIKRVEGYMERPQQQKQKGMLKGMFGG